MKRLLALVFAATVLPGCLGLLREMRENDRMKAWVGHPVTDLVSEWGAPSTVYKNGYLTIYEWQREVAAQSETTSSYNAFTRSTSTYATVHSGGCREWFEVDVAGEVVAWHWQGRC